MSVLDPESAEQIIAGSLERARKQADMVRRNAKERGALFSELLHSVTNGGMLRTTSRFIVSRHIEGPYLDGITAKGLYEEVLELVDESQVAYLRLVNSLVLGENYEKAAKAFRTIVVLELTGTGEKQLIATLRMPNLTPKEANGVLQSQEAAFFRMAAEVDERVFEQYRDTHG